MNEQINVSVGVNINNLMGIIGRTVTVMETIISQTDMVLYSKFCSIDPEWKLHEAVMEYTALVLGHYRTNIGLDYYLQEHFAEYYPVISQSPCHMQQITTLFIMAARELTSALAISQTQIDSMNYIVDSIHVMTRTQNNYLVYLVTGIKPSVVEDSHHWGNQTGYPTSELGSLLYPK